MTSYIYAIENYVIILRNLSNLSDIEEIVDLLETCSTVVLK